MDVLFQTRFSFYGASGWQSAASQDPELLFDPARLDQRLRYFEMITLPSLAAQTDQDFEHLILSSRLMPDAYQARLRELVHDVLGGQKATVLFRPEGTAGQIIRNTVRRRYGAKMLAQVVIDDDDALANDFVSELRRHAAIALTDGGDGHQEDYMFLSFARGFTLGIEDGRPAWLERRFVPYTNLGLAVIAPGTTKRNAFLVSHRKVGQRHPSMMMTHLRPYYLRAVHGLNDSRAIRQDLGLHPGDIDMALKYFPFLSAYFSPEQDAAAQ